MSLVLSLMGDWAGLCQGDLHDLDTPLSALMMESIAAGADCTTCPLLLDASSSSLFVPLPTFALLC